MKRNMDLIRRVLIEIEEADNDPDEWIDLSFAEWSDNAVSYHIKMLHDAGLIEARDLSDLSGSDWRPTSITWEGHEFLDAARNDTVWKKAMTKLKGQAASVPFEVVKAVVIQTCKEMFGVG